jgi:CPA1 family monovalent cation:H+ antiporter
LSALATVATYAALFGGAVLAATIASRIARIPYIVGLVVAGLAIGVWGHPASIALTPNLVLFFLLPALLFAGAWEIDLAQLRRYWIPIALLATMGVALGILVSYLLLTYGAGIDGRVAIVFGALVCATDPVAVIALFRQLRVDDALRTIVEGESLFNDGVAVAAFRTLVFSAAGTAGTLVFHPASAIETFAALSAGGSLVGIAVGFAAATLLRTVDRPAVEVIVTAIVAYGSYLLAEALHFSGIVAVIAAGLTCSGVRTAVGSTTRAQLAADRFWELAAFVANSVLFVLVGLTINLRSLAAVGFAPWWGVAAVIVARAVTVYGLAPVAAAAGSRLPRSWQHVIALGGLRGALCMALVLSLPEDFQYRTQLVAMVYSVVLFTIVVQGLSLGPAVRALRLARREHSA